MLEEFVTYLSAAPLASPTKSQVRAEHSDTLQPLISGGKT